ncbi:MAG: hypothetical protein ABIR06_00510 [Cyclobacteriaceae bacterium]
MFLSSIQLKDALVLSDASKASAAASEVKASVAKAEVTFSTDGTVAFVANGGSNNVTAINTTTKAVLATIEVGADPVGAWPGSDNKMYVDNEEGQTISVINVSTLNVEATIALGLLPTTKCMANFG